MVILGQEDILESSLIAQIQAEILSECGAVPMTPNYINSLAGGIAKVLIPFLIANVETINVETIRD